MADYLGTLRREGDSLVAVVKPHTYEPPPKRRPMGYYVTDPFCVRCGYHRLAGIDGLKVHPEEADRG